jgi:hypothetical protein
MSTESNGQEPRLSLKKEEKGCCRGRFDEAARAAVRSTSARCSGVSHYEYGCFERKRNLDALADL